MSEQQDSVDRRPIPGFEWYEAGRDGSIWSSLTGGCRRKSENFAIKRCLKWRALKPTKGAYGHGYVTLCREDGQFRFFVHYLIAITWIGPGRHGDVVRHLDGNPSNNLVENLAWGTSFDNKRDDYVNGAILLGEESPASKLLESQVLRIRELYANGAYAPELAKMFGMSEAQIRNVASGRQWKHVGGPLSDTRNRRASGESNCKAKLTDEQVVGIRTRYATCAEHISAIALRWGVTTGAIRLLLIGKTWRLTGGPIASTLWRIKCPRRNKVSQLPAMELKNAI